MRIVASSDKYFNFVRNNYSICFYGKALDKKIATVCQRIFSALKLLIAPFVLLIGSGVWIKDKIVGPKKIPQTIPKIKEVVQKKIPSQPKASPSIQKLQELKSKENITNSNVQKAEEVIEQSKLAIGGEAPIDHQLHILRFLKNNEIGKMCLVSKQAKIVAENDRLWTTIANKDQISLKDVPKNIKKFVVNHWCTHKESKLFIEVFKRFFHYEYENYLKRNKDWKPSERLLNGEPWKKEDGYILWSCFSICDSSLAVTRVAEKIKLALKDKYEIFEDTRPRVDGSEVIKCCEYANFGKKTFFDLRQLDLVTNQYCGIGTNSNGIFLKDFIIDETHIKGVEELFRLLPNFGASNIYVRTLNPEELPDNLLSLKKIEKEYIISCGIKFSHILGGQSSIKGKKSPIPIHGLQFVRYSSDN